MVPSRYDKYYTSTNKWVAGVAHATESRHQRYACTPRHHPSKKYLTTHIIPIISTDGTPSTRESLERAGSVATLEREQAAAPPGRERSHLPPKYPKTPKLPKY